MSDVTIRVASETHDRLASVAEAQGLSLRAWLDRLAETARTPAERTEEAERTRRVLREWSGYDPAVPHAEADELLARRIAEVRVA
ncbi:hypothetical protein ACWEWD_03615 [Streptomyces tendae]